MHEGFSISDVPLDAVRCRTVGPANSWNIFSCVVVAAGEASRKLL